MKGMKLCFFLLLGLLNFISFFFEVYFCLQDLNNLLLVVFLFVCFLLNFIICFSCYDYGCCVYSGLTCGLFEYIKLLFSL